MNLYVLTGGLAGLFVFLILSLRMKILIAFFIMSQCFDLAPRIIYGKLIWDYGAVLLLIAAAQLMFQWMFKKKTEPVRGSVCIIVLGVFTAWLFFCLLYSLLIYGYPILDTLKMSRQMVIGYLSFFIFLGLFAVDKHAFKVFMKWLYIITFSLLIVAIIQYITGRPLLFGLHREYGSITRYLPIFLPISLLYLWYILSRYFAAEPVKKHEFMYAGMVVFVTAITYTRGIYIAVLFSFLTMLFLLFKRGKVKVNTATIFIVVLTMGITVLMAGGWADRVINRAASGIEILFSGKVVSSKIDEDTYSGRWMLLKERFELVSEHNPIIGYGFIHEDNIPKKLRNSLKYGSVINTPEMVRKYKYGHPYVLALFSADIGWANIVLATGFIGFLIFLIFIGSFLLSYREKQIDDARLYHFHLAFYLQTITLLLLMFNGNTFTNQLQIPGLMIAGYLYCSSRRDVRSGNRLSVTTTGTELCH
jgi:O-Antigen ligase